MPPSPCRSKEVFPVATLETTTNQQPQAASGLYVWQRCDFKSAAMATDDT